MIVTATGSRSLVTSPELMEQAVTDTIDLLMTASETHDVTLRLGGAEGWDEAIAQAAALLDLPVAFHLPDANYGAYYWGASASKLKTDRTEQFDRMLSRHEAQTLIVKDSTCQFQFNGSGVRNLRRNCAMIDGADLCLVYHDGESRGTVHAMSECRTHNVPVRIWIPNLGFGPSTMLSEFTRGY